MADDDIAKAKKKPRKRRRSARVYINANRPLVVPLDEIAAHFPSDDEEPEDMGKSTVGNAVSSPGGRNPVDRVSPGLVAGHQALSSGDHGSGVDPMAVPGARELAFRHPASRGPAGTGMDLSTHTPFPLFTSRTNHDEFPADVRGMSSGVPVAMTRLDAAGATGVHAPPGNAVSRPLDHIARNSATPPTPGHSLRDPRSHAAPMATKGSDALRIMRDTQNMGRR